jgi:N-acetylneuraminate lyase
MDFRLTGLVAAAFTPMHPDGSLNPDQVGPVVDYLVDHGISAVYVCGSTGEGPLMTSEERRATAAAFVRAAAGRLPVVVQVGHSSLAEARQLAAHAQQIGADAVSAVCPYYFRPESVEVLLDCLAEITAGAPGLPFYYYHIPAITGVGLDMVELLRRAADKVPTLVGVKYTMPTLDEAQALREFEGGRFDVLHGRDEMLLAGLATGARGAIGSTYNFAAPLYRRMIAAFERGDLDEARRCQALSVAMIRAVFGIGGQAGLKAAMNLVGPDCGPVRLPLVTFSPEQTAELKADFEALGVFNWARPAR